MDVKRLKTFLNSPRVAYIIYETPDVYDLYTQLRQKIFDMTRKEQLHSWLQFINPEREPHEDLRTCS